MKIFPRVIPSLLLHGGALVKTVRFSQPKYVGDPINAVKIFNEKEVDELVLLDIAATIEGTAPAFDLIGEIASECFFPLAYGGGLRHISDIRTVLSLGTEKAVICSEAIETPKFVREAAEIFGSQSIVVSIDVRRSIWGKYHVYTRSGRQKRTKDVIATAVEMAQMGAGEIILTSIDRDGTGKGYDLELIKRLTAEVDIPVVASGGAGSVADLVAAINVGGASAVAAGSLFVFHGPQRAVLISYPDQTELAHAFEGQKDSEPRPVSALAGG